MFGHNRMNCPRPLTDEERNLAKWMIEHGDVAPEKYLHQLENAIVVGECDCGCASIDFQIGDKKPDTSAGMVLVSDWFYGPEDHFGAFIFTCDDVLAGLEVYSFTEEPARLPKPEELRPAIWNKTEPAAGALRHRNGEAQR